MKSIFAIIFTLFLFQNLSSQCVETGYNTGDLTTCSASYLGGDGIDAGTSIKILGNGDVVIAGTFNAIPTASNSFNYLSATSSSKGMVLVFNSTGTFLKSAIRLGDAVDDMDVNRNTNEIYAYGSFGLVKLNATGSSLLWQKTASPIGSVVSSAIYSSGRRVAVADNGDVVILGNSGTPAACNGFVYIYNSSGNPISTGNFTMPRSDIGGGTYNEKWEDIAIDSSTKQIFVTGMAQRCSAYQTSFLISYSYDTSNFGTELWQSFTLWCSGATTYSLTADARGKRVEFKNGELLFVGHADGGNNLFTKTVNDYTTNEPNLVTIDQWNNGAGFGSGKVGYFARINPSNGLVIKSQFQFSSTGVNQAKSYEIIGITSRNTGEILIGGISNKDMPDRATLKINGTSVGTRVDNESSFIGVSAGLNTRNWVATYTSSAASSKITDLDSHNGVIALLGECEGNIMTHNAIDSSKGTQTDVFFSVFGNDVCSTVVSNTNDSGPGSLREAVNCASSGDMITFDPSLANQTITLTSGHILITRNLTINAIDAPNLELNGNFTNRIFYQGWEWNPSLSMNVPSVVTYKNLKFINGFADGADYQLDGSGGAIFVLGVGNTIIVENCTFGNNESEGWGGSAVYIGNAGTGTFTNCLFLNNRANTDDDTANGDKGEKGGTLAISGNGQLSVFNCSFQNNLGVNGAGIFAGDTNLLVENSNFHNNNTSTIPQLNPNPSSMPDGRIYGFGAAICTDGANRNKSAKFQTLRSCTFTNNIAHGNGGAVFLYGYDGDVLTVEESTFTGNEVTMEQFSVYNASFGGGMRIGGGGLGSRTGPLPPLEVYVRKSTFDDNTSQSQGGGLWVQINGGGLAEIENCTIENNRSYYGDYITLNNQATTSIPRGNGGGINIALGGGSTALIKNSTITHNVASWQGGGINLGSGEGITNTTISNTISAYNEAENGPNTWNIKHNINKAAGAGGNNIQSNEFGTNPTFLDLLTSSGTTIADPLLSPLANNGGPTQTMALQAGSPAINAGSGCPAADQRGVARVGACDIGAFEFEGAPLPINLLFFNAELTQNKSVELNWATSSETNNDFFTIEKSRNTLNWEELTVVDGAGNSSSYLMYSTLDKTPHLGISYYRLKQTDFNGKYKYSSIKSITINEGDETLSIFPNPTAGLITFEGSPTELSQVKLRNALGQLIYNLDISYSSSSSVTIDLSMLPGGIYFVETLTKVSKIHKKR